MRMSGWKRGAVIFVAALGLLAYVGVAQLAWAFDEAATKSLFNEKCAKCHGESGKGDGPKAKTLKKKPMDYTDKAKMAKLTDEELLKVTREGKKPMPAYGSGRNQLTDQQITDLIAYIRTFSK
jgi:mono/diheme cytochrome c family protein